MHNCMYSALHTPPRLYRPNRNRKKAENKKAQGNPLNKIIIQHRKVVLAFGCGDTSELRGAGLSR